ncbi:hypothetical protein ONS96_014828 [Cadophora gregata f. sp. sojae]|nr:hypothetical protein ONS96_014828 [Cadophora gregata f. sp. sojae]
MSCFFLCKKSDAYSSYQTVDSESGTEGSTSTAWSTDTALTATSAMSELSNQERAEFVSFTRVAACMINEKLVESTFTEKTVTISHPKSTDAITLQLVEKHHFPGYVHPLDIGTEITYNGVPIHLKGSCMMNIFGRWAGMDVSKLLPELENSALNLEAVYNNPPVIRFESPSIDWEQSLIE